MKRQEKPNPIVSQANLGPVLISRRDVASLLQVSTMTVKRYQRKGLLRAVYFGPRLIRYAKQDVLDLIDKCAA